MCIILIMIMITVLIMIIIIDHHHQQFHLERFDESVKQLADRLALRQQLHLRNVNKL